MKRLVAAAMEDGAMGLSTALLQPPSSFATTANLSRAGRDRAAVRGHLLDTYP